MKPQPPATIRYFGDYVLLGRIAEGAMGEVWFARQENLGRPVALKLIRVDALASATEVERFHVEAQAAARLKHENIVRVFEAGEHEGRHFLSMELIEGESLAQKWARTTRSRSMDRDLRAGIALISKVARAAHHAHLHGVIHRDIKPANILVDEKGEPHLSDFGVAKLVDVDERLTRSGAILGTLNYMSPEQASGKSALATTASDTYSLGAVFYELLAGRPPFEGDDVASLLRQVSEDEPIPPSRARLQRSPSASISGGSKDRPTANLERLDPDLEVICLKCLEKSPARRYASAAALADDLDRWLRGEPIHARPVGDFERARKWVGRHPVVAGLSAALVAALVLGLATTTWQWFRAEQQRSLTAAALAGSQLQRAEDLFGSEKALAALPIVARVLRDNPGSRVAQERLVNALNHRAFLALRGSPLSGSSSELQLALRVARTAQHARTAVATNEDATLIQLFDVVSGKLLQEAPRAHSNVIRSLSIGQDDQRLVSASADGTARIWELDSLRLLSTLPHSAGVCSAEFSPNGERVLTAARDGFMRWWDARRGELLFEVQANQGALAVARCHPDGGLIATGAEDGTVQLWTAEESRFRRFSEPFTFSGSIWNLAFLSNSVAVTLDDGTTRNLIWTQPHRSRISSNAGGARRRDERSGVMTNPPQPINQVLGHSASQFHSAAITSTNMSSDGRLLATGSLDRTARLWDVRTMAPATEPLVHSASVNGVCFSPDSRRLATSTPGGIVRVWDTATGQPLTDWIQFDQPVAYLTFSLAGDQLQTSSGETWPIHNASLPTPDWLIDLAESLGGSRLDKAGRVMPGPIFTEVSQGVLGSTSTSPLVLWGQQLLHLEIFRR